MVILLSIPFAIGHNIDLKLQWQPIFWSFFHVFNVIQELFMRKLIKLNFIFNFGAEVRRCCIALLTCNMLIHFGWRRIYAVDCWRKWNFAKWNILRAVWGPENGMAKLHVWSSCSLLVEDCIWCHLFLDLVARYLDVALRRLDRSKYSALFWLLLIALYPLSDELMALCTLSLIKMPEPLRVLIPVTNKTLNKRHMAALKRWLWHSLHRFEPINVILDLRNHEVTSILLDQIGV